MSKVLTFSRVFPAYHPRKGEPTYFVEKLITAFDKQLTFEQIADFPLSIANIIDYDIFKDAEPKSHTIRGGNRFKVGDKFSPRVWSGKPYASKQIIIAPDIEVKKVWDFEICNVGTKDDADNVLCIDGCRLNAEEVQELAINDGLSFMDLMEWFRFPKPFKGQVISWSEEINY